MKQKKLGIFKKSLLCVFLATASLSNTACLEDLDPQRTEIQRGSFGTELHRILALNTVNSPVYGDEVHTRTFENYRNQFIEVADAIAIEEDLGDLNQVFRNIVPLYENQLYPGTLRKAATLMDEWRQDPAAVDALAYFVGSPTLLKNAERANLPARIFSYDEIAKVTKQLLDMLLEDTDKTYNATTQIVKALSIELKDLEYDSEPSRFLYRTIDLLTRSDDIYGPAMSIEPQEAVRINDTGWPDIIELDGTRVYPPFVDQDHDGTADGNLYGYYTIESGGRISPYQTIQGTSSYFSLDADGHLSRFDKPVFQYFDLQKTPLAYLIREADELLLDNTLDDLLRATHTLLGDGQTYTDEHGDYVGFSKTSGISQLASALFATLDHDSVGPNFEAVIHLLNEHPDEMARLIHDVDKILDIVDETETELAKDLDLVDRLMPQLLELAQEPGLLSDLLIALDDPMTAKLGPIMADLLERRNTLITYDPDSAWAQCANQCHVQYAVGTNDHFDCIVACDPDQILGTAKVDRTQPESEENRSLFQRITHLMWETSKQPYDVYTEKLVVSDVDMTDVGKALGKLIVFDNLAESYLHTITGKLALEEHLSATFINLADILHIEASTVASLFTWITENLFKIKLSLYPTTAEVTRLFNMNAISSKNELYTFDLNVATCKDGRSCAKANADTLFALEATGMVDALYPVVKVFNDHNKSALFAQIVATLFEYYPSGDYPHTLADGKPMPVQYANFRSFEPILQRALAETPVIEDLGKVGDILLNMPLSDGSKLLDRFADYVTYLLTPDPKLKNAFGQNSTKDPKGQVIAPLSPAYLYIDAIRSIADVSDAHPELSDQLSNGLEGLMRVTIKTTQDPTGKVVFEKPAGIHLLATVIELLHTLYLEQTEKNNRTAWVNDDMIPGVQNLFSNRIVYSYFDLLAKLDHDNGLENFRKLVLWLMESGSQTPTILTGSAYLLFSWLLEQNHLIAVSHLMANIIDPDRVWHTGAFDHLSFVVTVLACVNAFNQCDPTESFNHMFYRLLETDTHKTTNLLKLFQVGYAMFRPDPGTHVWCESDCHKGLLDFAYDFFTDKDRGVERIYEIIDFTIWGIDRRPEDWRPEDASWQLGY